MTAQRNVTHCFDWRTMPFIAIIVAVLAGVPSTIVGQQPVDERFRLAEEHDDVQAKFEPSSRKTDPGRNEELWYGTLEFGIAELRLLVRLTPSGEGFQGILVSLDQDNAEIPVDDVVRDDTRLRLTLKRINAAFEGELNSDGTEATGTWTQLGRKAELVLRHVKEIPKPSQSALRQKRPQTPQPPFPYRSLDVSFESVQDGVSLAGTLTLPADPGQHPGAVLITGSGPQDRDETLLGHKPFHVLADYLTRRGIAVLRYDDRGVGKSSGNHATATTADFADDARAAARFLAQHPDVDSQRIGLIGHSEGALIAALIASSPERTTQPNIAFLVSIAGTGVTGAEILAKQTELVSKAAGATQTEISRSLALQRAIIAAIRKSPRSANLKDVVKRAVETHLAQLPKSERDAVGPKEPIIARAEQWASRWFRFFIDHDPRPNWAQLRCPVLAIWGEYDLQASPDQNLPEIERALMSGGNENYQVIVLPKLNHLLQTAKTGSPAEYNTIEETMAPSALRIINKWIVDVLDK